MAADVSRVRINPLLDYAGVELKQGGVLLDADANELVAVLDRRLRALSSDVLGRATVGANTPDAFRVTVGGAGLLIGRGRLYVDGLLAENHGAADPAQREFDDLLAESRFAAAVPYDAQPYLPDPPPLPEAGRHLVYLDVWDREVTHLENPGLIETAVGVETSSRRQIVWQVRVLAEEADTATCSSPDEDIAGWVDVIAPSTGRLTTGTYEVSAVTDPCELPPTGGYRGLENQLYRVEVHDPGQPGAGATFKWSRDSVGSRVSSMVSDSALELESLGRDAVLRFNAGDWVEITDDVREFSQSPGEVRKIATINEATRRITFTPALPGDMLPATFPDSAFARARNVRVRRWDQNGRVLSASGGGATEVFQDLDEPAATGVIDIPQAGTTLLLEHGVTVNFDSLGDKGFRVGDFWVFAARTADASVERLDSAPPRGIHHHFARLAIWDVAAGSVSDCRTPWPPSGGGEDCGCSACVTPESHASGALTIQGAVDRLRDVGGTVCLAPGEYVLREPVRLAQTHGVRVRGQGPATNIVAPTGGFAIDSARSPAIEDLQIMTAGIRPAVSVTTATNLVLERLVIFALPPQRDQPGLAITLSGTVLWATIRDNFIFARIGLMAPELPDPDEEESPQFVSAGLTIEANQWICERSGIAFGVGSFFAGEQHIARNSIGGCTSGGIRMHGFFAPSAWSSVLDNHLIVRSSGIEVAGTGLRISGNKVECQEQPVGERIAGISIVTGADPTGADQCQILSNQITDFPGPGISSRVPVRELLVEQNIIARCGGGIECFADDAAGTLAIRSNAISDIGVIAEPTLNVVAGIYAGGIQTIEVSDNVLRRIGQVAFPEVVFRAGILTGQATSIRVNGNLVSEVGPPDEFLGITAGVFVISPLVDAEVGLNHVVRDAVPVTAPSRSLWAALVVATSNQFGPRTDPFPFLSVDDKRAVRFGPGRPVLLARAESPLKVRNAIVHGNVTQSRGGVETAALVVAERCVFSDNTCELRFGSGTPVVRISADSIVASSNQVRGGAPSVVLAVDARRTTVLGNITSSGIVVADSPLQAPWDSLNVQV
jgi:hypothetical protein